MIRRETYEVLEEGWVAGVRVAAGDRLELTAAEAKYERVVLVQPQPVSPSGSTGRKLRKAAS